MPIVKQVSALSPRERASDKSAETPEKTHPPRSCERACERSAGQLSPKWSQEAQIARFKSANKDGPEAQRSKYFRAMTNYSHARYTIGRKRRDPATDFFGGSR